VVEPGRLNFIFGTYTRSTTTGRNTAESSNGHWYHQYNIPITGERHQVIDDWHPHHQRGESGNAEQGIQQYPTNGPGYNYFDLLTRVYFEVGSPTAPGPYQIMVDDVELYYEPNDENVEEIYAVNGTYKPSENRLLIGWSRLKTANGSVNEVRYA